MCGGFFLLTKPYLLLEMADKLYALFVADFFLVTDPGLFASPCVPVIVSLPAT
jgi:hypothetical protein